MRFCAFLRRQNWLDVFVVGMSILDLASAAVPSWLVRLIRAFRVVRLFGRVRELRKARPPPPPSPPPPPKQQQQQQQQPCPSALPASFPASERALAGERAPARICRRRPWFPDK